jgi:hypothetical protein
LRPQDRNRRLLDELAQEAGKELAPADAPPVPAADPAAVDQARVHASGPRRLAADLFAGLIVGLVTLTFSISCAALIFSGPLTPYLPLGIASAVISPCLTLTP